jgi:hypothetical protein
MIMGSRFPCIPLQPPVIYINQPSHVIITTNIQTNRMVRRLWGQGGGGEEI